MAQLAALTALVGVNAAGTIISSNAAIEEGKQRKQAADFEAAQLDKKAASDRASAQRVAAERQRQARMLQSRALAAAAASGAGAGDGDVSNILGDLGAEGDLSARSALYEGETSAQYNERSAQQRRIEGNNAKRAGNVRAFTTILQGASSMFSRFGGGG